MLKQEKFVIPNVENKEKGTCCNGEEKNLVINQWKKSKCSKTEKEYSNKESSALNLKKKVLVLKHQKNLLVVNLKKKFCF